MKAASPYWSALASSLSPYVPGEQPRGRRFIKLNTNENPYPPSPKVIEAINKAANESLRLYPDPACTVMREAAASRWKIKPEQVFCGNGSDEILAFAFAAFFDRVNANTGASVNTGTGAPPVLFPKVTYSFYPVYAALWGVPFAAPPLGGGFTVMPEDYTRDSGGVILPNPNAPTGRALSIGELRAIAAAQEKNKNVLIVDEAYIAFADAPGVGSMISFINEHPNMLVVRTLSKDASLAGLRSGYAAGSAELIEGLSRIRDSFNSYTVDRLALAASEAALADAQYYDEINRRVRATRERVSAALAALGFDVIPSQANFIFAAPPGATPPGATPPGATPPGATPPGATPPPGASKSAADFQAALREKGVLVRHFRQAETEKYLRVSIGTDDDMDAFLKSCDEIIG